MTDYPGLRTWLLTGEHGQSSLAIANRLRFATVATHTDHPYDPADFRRCELLLRAAPTMRRDLHRMADVSDEWAALVPHWDLLVAAMEAEIPGVFDGPARGRAPVTCALIQHLTGRTNR